MFVGLLLSSTFILVVLLLIDLVLQCISRSKNIWFKENRVQNYRSSQTTSIFRSETTNSNLAPIRENVIRQNVIKENIEEESEEYKERPTFTKTK